MAQWSRRLATNQKIPGSSPGGEELFFAADISTKLDVKINEKYIVSFLKDNR